ncbi:MAG: eukaryotic-like serine/threonine-protein kinase [Acidobacteriota bacterium]|nr:eukaryotic-like serine/threonine-protein kinase [Acidobacteriota bacterium]
MRWLSDAALERLKGSEDLPAPDDGPEIPGGRYEVLAEIGRGGMGTVYLARDRDLDREVALKVLRLALPDVATRMLREARILARLEHPGIVPVHDVGTLPDGRIFYAMRRVRGQHLDAYARTATLPELLRAFERVLDAVAFAHAHGVIHRDLKPDNVLVGPFGDVLVMDWGVAKLRAEAGEGEAAGSPNSHLPGQTAHGTVLGTPGYMAPEQARGEVEGTDERADVYALGRMLAALLGDMGDLPAGLPRPLAGICARATAAAPTARYPSVGGMADDLGRYLAGLPVGAYREGLLERVGRLARRYRVAILLVLAYLAMRILLLVLLHR